MPLVSRTRATLRRAEFGFFGVVVYTRVQTPRRCGDPLRAGVLVFDTLSWRPLRTSCWMVGTVWFSFLSCLACVASLLSCAWSGIRAPMSAGRVVRRQPGSESLKPGGSFADLAAHDSRWDRWHAVTDERDLDESRHRDQGYRVL